MRMRRRGVFKKVDCLRDDLIDEDDHEELCLKCLCAYYMSGISASNAAVKRD